MRNEYIEDLRYAQYIVEMTAEEEKLRGFAETIIGVHEGASSRELYAIREGVGDKITNVWNKFTALLNRIWEKFTNYANRAIYNQVEYLEHYRDIILNRKPNDFDFEMSDYPVGIQRLSQITIPVFSTVEAKVMTEATDTSFMKSLIPDYDEKTPWPAYCAQYFEGGAQMKPANLSNLNMTDLYNFCHDFGTRIKPIIEKDQKTLAGTFDSIKSQIQGAKTKVAAAGATAAKTDEKVEDKDKTQESFIDQYASRYFNEAIDLKGGSDGDNSGKTNAAPTSAQTAGNAAATAQSSTKVGSATGTNTGVASLQTNKDDEGKDTTAKVDVAKKSEDDLKILEDKLKNYNTAATGILTGKLTASQNIFNDYMKLIKMHIKQQVGAAGTNDAAQSGTDSNLGVDLSGYGDAKAIAELVNGDWKQIKEKTGSYADPQANATARKTIIDKVKQKNPNFQGNFDDIYGQASALVNANNKKEENKKP